MSVREVGTPEFLQLAGRTQGKLVVVQFSATWCGPCRRIAPAFEALAKRTPDVEFVKVYEHTSRDAMMAAGVRSMPTFHFYCGGAKVDECRGANIQAVEQRVLQHKGAASAVGGPITIKLRFDQERARQTGSGSILVAEEVELEVHASEGLEIFKFQVLSVTDIETEDQVLTTGDTDSPVDSDAALASALQRSGGGVYGNYPVLRVTRRAAGAASTTRRDGGGRGTPRSGALSDAQADETTAGDVGETPKWDECCSRIVFGADPVLQPAYVIREESLLPQSDLTPLQKKSKGPESILVLCKACAENCFLPGRAEPCPAISTTMRFVCESEEACAKGYGSDLFSERVRTGTEVCPPGSQARANAEAAAAAAADRVPHPTKGLLPTAGAGGEEDDDMVVMRRTVEGGVKQALGYEGASSQERALEMLPRTGQDGDGRGTMQRRGKEMAVAGGYSDEEGLARALLSWFKKDFFRWMSKPNCSSCGASGPKMEPTGVEAPKPMEASARASRVEVYQCKDCGERTRFPRYGDPVKLLETRTGRCGEWANCFTLMCRAVKLEARHVQDWTDHVWTEIWIPAKNRWVHADPCENKLDMPLMYEQGWNKRLSYVVAYGKDGAVDVTRRYTRQWSQVLSRRALVPENWLAGVLASTRSPGPTAGTGDTKARLAEEEAELKAYETMSVDAGLHREEQEGRQSGDADWVASRGEDGDVTAGPKEDQTTRVDMSQSSCPMIGAPLGISRPGGGLSLSVAAVLVGGGGGSGGSRAGGSLMMGDATVCRAEGGRILCAAAVSASTGILIDSRIFFGGGGDGFSSSSPSVVGWLSSMPDGVVIAIAASGWDMTKPSDDAAAANDSKQSEFETAMNTLIGGGAADADRKDAVSAGKAPASTSAAAPAASKGASWTLLGWKGKGAQKWTRRQFSDDDRANSRRCAFRCASHVELFIRPIPSSKDTVDDGAPKTVPHVVELKDRLCLASLCSSQAPQEEGEAAASFLRGSPRATGKSSYSPPRGVCFRTGEPSVFVGPGVELVHCEGWTTALETPCLAGVERESGSVEIGAWRFMTVSAAVGGWHDDTESFDDAAVGCPALIIGGPPLALPPGEPFLPAGRIREIVGWGGDNVNGVQVVYDVEGVAVRGPKHMGEHGLYRQSSLVLDVAGGEVVTSISVKAGCILDSLTIRTSTGREKKWGGDGGDTCHTWKVPPGCAFLGFRGGIGGHIHCLGVTLAECDRTTFQQQQQQVVVGSGKTTDHCTIATSSTAMTDRSPPLSPTVTTNLYSDDAVRRAYAQMLALSAAASSTPTTAASANASAEDQPTASVTADQSSNDAALFVATPADIVTALETALKYADNLLKAPLDPRVSRIRLGNGFFDRKIGKLPGGGGLLRAMGFHLMADDERRLQYVFRRSGRAGGLEGLRRARVALAELLADVRSASA